MPTIISTPRLSRARECQSESTRMLLIPPTPARANIMLDVGHLDSRTWIAEARRLTVDTRLAAGLGTEGCRASFAVSFTSTRVVSHSSLIA